MFRRSSNSPLIRLWVPFRDKDFLVIKDVSDMRYSDTALLYRKESWQAQTLSDLARHEGFRAYAYPDPLSKLGKKYKSRKWNWGFEPGDILLAKYGENERDGRPWTVGFGVTRGINPASHRSMEYARQELEKEMIEHLKDLHKLVPDWKDKPLWVSTVLASLVYNLGYDKLKKFEPTLQLFREGKYKEAAARLRKTAWFAQVGIRSEELVQRLEKGRIAQEHLI